MQRRVTFGSRQCHASTLSVAQFARNSSKQENVNKEAGREHCVGAKHNVIPLFVLIPSSQSAAVSSSNSALSAWNRRYWFVVVVASVEVAGDDGAERERACLSKSKCNS